MTDSPGAEVSLTGAEVSAKRGEALAQAEVVQNIPRALPRGVVEQDLSRASGGATRAHHMYQLEIIANEPGLRGRGDTARAPPCRARLLACVH
jgi:hypothetical protein